MEYPAWFRQLKWAGGIHVAALIQERSQIPDFPGCYVFAIGRVTIAPGRVLYVGEAAGQSLRKRLSNYLVDFGAPRSGKEHKGKGFVNFLNPAANDRIEEHRHPLLGDGELLDPRLIR